MGHSTYFNHSYCSISYLYHNFLKLQDLIWFVKANLIPVRPASNYKKVIMGLLRTPEDFDATELHEAMKDLGTNEEVLVEILVTRTNEELMKIRERYDAKYWRIGKKIGERQLHTSL